MDDVKSVWPLCLGLHTCYNGWYNGMQYREVEQILKTGLSSDCSLQLDYMKSESLVKAYQQRRLEIRSRALYTPPVTSWELIAPEVTDPTRKGGRCRRCD